MRNVGPFSQHNVTRRTISDGYIDSMLTADFGTHYQLIKTLGLTRGGGINVRVRHCKSRKLIPACQLIPVIQI